MFVLLEPEMAKRKKNEEKTYSTVYCYWTGLPLDFGLIVNIAIEIMWSRWSGLLSVKIRIFNFCSIESKGEYQRLKF